MAAQRRLGVLAGALLLALALAEDIDEPARRLTTCGSVTGASDTSGATWYTGGTIADDNYVNDPNERDYKFAGVPSLIDGGDYIYSSTSAGTSWPGQNAVGTWDWTIQYNPPVTIAVFEEAARNVFSVVADSAGSGWVKQSAPNFLRTAGSNSNQDTALSVWTKYIDSGSQITLELSGLLVGGVSSLLTCETTTITETITTTATVTTTQTATTTSTATATQTTTTTQTETTTITATATTTTITATATTTTTITATATTITATATTTATITATTTTTTITATTTTITATSTTVTFTGVTRTSTSTTTSATTTSTTTTVSTTTVTTTTYLGQTFTTTSTTATSTTATSTTVTTTSATRTSTTVTRTMTLGGDEVCLHGELLLETATATNADELVTRYENDPRTTKAALAVGVAAGLNSADGMEIPPEAVSILSVYVEGTRTPPTPQTCSDILNYDSLERGVGNRLRRLQRLQSSNSTGRLIVDYGLILTPAAASASNITAEGGLPPLSGSAFATSITQALASVGFTANLLDVQAMGQVYVGASTTTTTTTQTAASATLGLLFIAVLLACVVLFMFCCCVAFFIKRRDDRAARESVVVPVTIVPPQPDEDPKMLDGIVPEPNAESSDGKAGLPGARRGSAEPHGGAELEDVEPPPKGVCDIENTDVE